MAVTVDTSGSQTTTVTTEHTLATITNTGAFQWKLQFNAMVGGTTPDIMEVRVYETEKSSGTERLAQLYSLIGAQSIPSFSPAPVLQAISHKVTILHVQGTSIAVSWGAHKAV